MRQLTAEDIEPMLTELERDIVGEVEVRARNGEVPSSLIRMSGQREILRYLLAELEKEDTDEQVEVEPSKPAKPENYNLNGVSDWVITPPEPSPHKQPTPTDTTGLWRPFGEVEMLHSKKYEYVSIRYIANRSKTMRFESWDVVQQIYKVLPDESGVKEVQTAMRFVVPDKKHDKTNVFLLMRLYDAHPSFQCELIRGKKRGSSLTLVKHDGQETAHVDTGDTTTLDKSEVV